MPRNTKVWPDRTKVRSPIRCENVLYRRHWSLILRNATRVFGCVLYCLPVLVAMLPTRNKDICKTAEDVGHQLGYTQIKAEQKHAIVSFVQGNDVFVVLPATGFGKSLCYACLPLIFDRLSGKSGSIALIISPLVALMQDQVKGFSTIGIKCARVGSCTEEQVRQEIIDGEYQLVFISPEALLATRRWRKMLLSPVYQKSDSCSGA